MALAKKLNFDVLEKNALLFVISGPSGVGKDSVIKRLRAQLEKFHFVITVNTRTPRPEEVEGVDYFFVTKAQFKEMIKNDEFVEWAHVYGDYKGVPKAQIESALASGKDVLMRLDVQGAKTVRRIYPHAVLIFLLPPNEEEWQRRLLNRAKEQGTDEDMELRIKQAKEELTYLSIFDYAVVNAENKLEQTVETILAIVIAEHHRLKR